MEPNYEFIGINATRLYYGLEQLRTSAEFRAMEAVVAERYENVVIIVADGVVPYKTPTGTNFAEATTFLDKTRYIYIDTSTTTVKMEDGVWKNLSVEQIFTHALAHAASDIRSGPFTNLSPTTASELEAVNRTNIVTQEAQLLGPRNTSGVQFVPQGSPGFAETLFSDGSATIHIQEFLQPFPSAADVMFGRPVNRIEQEYNIDGDTSRITGYADSGDKGVVDIDQKGEQSWSQKETWFDAQENVRSVDTYNDDGSRAVSGFDEAGFEIWNYEREANGAGSLTNGGDSLVNFDANQTPEFSHSGDNTP